MSPVFLVNASTWLTVGIMLICFNRGASSRCWGASVYHSNSGWGCHSDFLDWSPLLTFVSSCAASCHGNPANFTYTEFELSIIWSILNHRELISHNAHNVWNQSSSIFLEQNAWNYWSFFFLINRFCKQTYGVDVGDWMWSHWTSKWFILLSFFWLIHLT